MVNKEVDWFEETPQIQQIPYLKQKTKYNKKNNKKHTNSL